MTKIDLLQSHLVQFQQFRSLARNISIFVYDMHFIIPQVNIIKNFYRSHVKWNFSLNQLRTLYEVVNTTKLPAWLEIFGINSAVCSNFRSCNVLFQIFQKVGQQLPNGIMQSTSAVLSTIRMYNVAYVYMTLHLPLLQTSVLEFRLR